jgi:hypothetical protein
VRTSTNEVLSYLAVAAGSIAVIDPALIAAVGGPKAVAVALIVKGVLGAATEQLKRMKAKEIP